MLTNQLTRPASTRVFLSLSKYCATLKVGHQCVSGRVISAEPRSYILAMQYVNKIGMYLFAEK